MNPIKDIKKLIKEGHNLFITGGGGVGKSYILDKISKEFPIVKTSTTGVSALHIKGQTIHSWASVGYCNEPAMKYIHKIYKNKKKLKIIQSAEILAIDEISMLGSNAFTVIEEVLRQVRGINKPFGGLQIILIGDFFQLPPVNENETFCFATEVWNKLNLKTVILKKVYRQQEKALIDTLNNIRQGSITNEQMSLLANRQCTNDDVDKEAIRIYSTRRESSIYNAYCYNQLDGEEQTYLSLDAVLTKINGRTEYQNVLSVELSDMMKIIYSSFSENCMFEPTVSLKPNARVMLLANLDFDLGLVNGSCGYVRALSHRAVEVEFDNGVTWTVKYQKTAMIKDEEEIITRHQIPLKLAYSSTIHKVQGMSFDKVFIDLGSVFTSGQTYVGLSRVKSLDGLFINNFQPNKVIADPLVVSFYNYLESRPDTVIFN